MFVVLYSSGHLLVITGYNWDYWDDTFYKSWGPQIVAISGYRGDTTWMYHDVSV